METPETLVSFIGSILKELPLKEKTPLFLSGPAKIHVARFGMCLLIMADNIPAEEWLFTSKPGETSSPVHLFAIATKARHARECRAFAK